jgi:hypothetical protein
MKPSGLFYMQIFEITYVNGVYNFLIAKLFLILIILFNSFK